MALFAWIWLPNRALSGGGLQVIFIGLAALTLPHVVLHWLVRPPATSAGLFDS